MRTRTCTFMLDMLHEISQFDNLITCYDCIYDKFTFVYTEFRQTCENVKAESSNNNSLMETTSPKTSTTKSSIKKAKQIDKYLTKKLFYKSKNLKLLKILKTKEFLNLFAHRPNRAFNRAFS